MFDLEKALAAWRRSLTFNRTFQPEDVDELERHLRDQVKDLVASGFSEEDAFRKAREQFGQYGDVEREYRKVRWESLSSRGRILQELLARLNMLTSYFKISCRSFRKQPLYFALNLIGLTVGIASVLLIGLFVRHEKSYDLTIRDVDRVFRLVHMGERTTTSALLGPTLNAEFPEIKSAARISHRFSEVRVSTPSAFDVETRFFFADSTFFDVLDFPLVSGDSRMVLSEPFSLVITQAMAEKYFGQRDPTGKTVKIESFMGVFDFTITGVAADMKGNTHFEFDFLASFSSRYRVGEPESSIDSWYSLDPRTYVRLIPGAGIASIEAQMEAFALKHYPDRIQYEGIDAHSFQPIRSIHLDSQLTDEWRPGGDRKTLNIFQWVATLVLLVAGLNYVNMATARSIAKAREVGVRKVVGASRIQLCLQFFVEAFLMMLFSGTLAFVVAVVAIPWFGNLSGRVITPDLLANRLSLIVMVFFVVASTFFAGSYPAWVIARFKPTQTLKGLATDGRSKALLRKVLVCGQFAVSVILLFATGILSSQLDYLQNRKLGMNPDQVIVINNGNAIDLDRLAVFKDLLGSSSAIESVASSSAGFPLDIHRFNRIYPERPEGTWTEEELAREVVHIGVGQSFLSTMQIALLEGRDFDPTEVGPDRDRSYLPTIINQRAVDMLGWEDPIGMEFKCCFRPSPRVVGVMADFHFESAREQIRPLAVSLGLGGGSTLVRVAPEAVSTAIGHIEAVWKEMAPGWPLEWAFMDDQFAAAYTAERRLADSFRLFSGLAVLIACLGLFGLATISVQSRVREIGIRKAVGAKAEQVVRLVMMDLMKPIAAALIIGLPVAGWLAFRWLQDFPYRVELGPWPFIQIAALTLLVASATISLHTWRAARINPADAIRHE